MQSNLAYENLLYHAFPNQVPRTSTPKPLIDPLQQVYYANNSNPATVFPKDDRMHHNRVSMGEQLSSLPQTPSDNNTNTAPGGYESLLEWMENNFNQSNGDSSSLERMDSLPSSVNLSASSSSSTSGLSPHAQEPTSVMSSTSEADSSFSMDFSSLFESPAVVDSTNFDWSMLTEDNLNDMLNEFYPSLAGPTTTVTSNTATPANNTTTTTSAAPTCGNPNPPLIPTINIPLGANLNNQNVSVNPFQQQPAAFFNNAARINGFTGSNVGGMSTPSSQWNSPYCRPISPMSGLSTPNFGCEDLDERERKKHRRETHNMVERKRRDQMNLKIQELSSLIPLSWLNRPETPFNNTNGSVTSGSSSNELSVKPNKSMILDKSVEYIHYLQKLIAVEQKKNAKLEQMVNEFRNSAATSVSGSSGGGETTTSSNKSSLQVLDASKKHRLD